MIILLEEMKLTLVKIMELFSEETEEICEISSQNLDPQKWRTVIADFDLSWLSATSNWHILIAVCLDCSKLQELKI